MKNFFLRIKISLFYVFLCMCIFTKINARSRFRTLSHPIPKITIRMFTKNVAKKTVFYSEVGVLESIHIRPWVYLTTYDKNYYKKKMFPCNKKIKLRNNKDSINSKDASEEINKAIQELMNVKRGNVPARSIILKDQDWNYSNHSGLVIVKLKNYPFVLKVYRETPYTFSRPFTKGIAPILFFRTGGGLTRHLSGLTRIPSSEIVYHYISRSEAWKDKVSLPRKWMWMPKKPSWLLISGKENFSFNAIIPSLYAIVCDEINIERSFSVFNEEDRQSSVTITNLLEGKLDNNISNFVIEKETQKIIIIDTEYFSTMLGLKEPIHWTSYYSWMSKLVFHSIYKVFGTHKKNLIRECKELPDCFNVYKVLSHLQKENVGFKKNHQKSDSITASSDLID